MIAIPFIYFLFFFIYVVKRKTIKSLVSVVLLLYTITSLGAILIDFFNAYGGSCPETKINFTPTILYCSLITLILIPFLQAKDEKIQHISIIKNTFFIDIMVYIYFGIFLFMILFLTPDIIRNMTLANIDENIKADFRFGNINYLTVGGWELSIAKRCMQLSTGSLNLLFIFFYSICFLKKKLLYNLMILLGSLTTCISSLITLDRSRIVYWLMVFILCTAFFYRFMNQKTKSVIIKAGIIFLSMGVIYIVIMNILRFGNRSDMDTNYFLLSYLGQSFINFCNFYEHLFLSEYSIHAAFPIIYHWFGEGSSSIAANWFEVIQARSGIFIMCFSTFLGEFLSTIGLFNTILWCLGCYISLKILLRRKTLQSISFFKLHLMFVLINIPYLGIFAHFYHEYTLNICTIIFLIISYISNNLKYSQK